MDKELTIKTQQLVVTLEETEAKKAEVNEKTQIQEAEVAKLNEMKKQIEFEKRDCEKSKQEALELAEKFDPKDIKEFAGYNTPPVEVANLCK